MREKELKNNQIRKIGEKKKDPKHRNGSCPTKRQAGTAAALDKLCPIWERNRLTTVLSSFILSDGAGMRRVEAREYAATTCLALFCVHWDDVL